ncbi:MAG: GspH/FimT family pseudopilin [Planctomycetota bacterium]|jgi:prepilin-type N-terminal cleavage/methylation domain-containing protein
MKRLNMKYRLNKREDDESLRLPFEISGGFTIVEILIVLVILGIAVAMAVPMFGSSAGIQVQSAANMIAADLAYAKSMAISRQNNYSVVFDSANECYEIRDESGSVIDHPVKKGFSYAVDFSNDSRLDRVDISSADFDSGDEIRFDYMGSPKNSSGGDLSSDGIITLQADEGTVMTVEVEPVTGFITVN